MHSPSQAYNLPKLGFLLLAKKTRVPVTRSLLTSSLTFSQKSIGAVIPESLSPRPTFLLKLSGMEQLVFQQSAQTHIGGSRESGRQFSIRQSGGTWWHCHQIASTPAGTFGKRCTCTTLPRPSRRPRLHTAAAGLALRPNWQSYPAHVGLRQLHTLPQEQRKGSGQTCPPSVRYAFIMNPQKDFQKQQDAHDTLRVFRSMDALLHEVAHACSSLPLL